MDDVMCIPSSEEEEKGKHEKSPRKGTILRNKEEPKDAMGGICVEEKENIGNDGSKRRSNQFESDDCNSVTGNNLSIFNKFLQFCYHIEVDVRKGDAKFMTVIMDKLFNRYKNADPEYTQSEVFRDAVIAAQSMVENDQSNLFVHMKQVDEELKGRKIKTNNHKRKAGCEDDRQRKKRSKVTESDASECEDSFGVNKSHVKKLEILFEKVYRKVKKLEEKEVDWENEENSQFLRLERYKKRLCSIWEKWQEVRGRAEEVNKLKHRKLVFSSTLYPELNYAIEKFVNKTKCFPDFMDILKIATNTLNKDKEFTEDRIKTIAIAAFQALGEQLKKRRLFEFWNCCSSYFPTEYDGTDPADQNNELAIALKTNEEVYKKDLANVLNKYVDQQVNEHLEPVEVVLDSDAEASAPSGDEGEEEEEEEEPEDIICISSTSSEESDGEIVMDTKQPQNNKGKDNPNGKLAELDSEKESATDTVVKHSHDYIPLSTDDLEKPPISPGLVKVEKEDKSVKEESTTSCSSGQKNINSTSGVFSGKKQTKELDIIILSESDSS